MSSASRLPAMHSIHSNKNFLRFVTAVAVAAFTLAACKTTDKKDATERMAINCATNPPTRIDYREDMKTVESTGPIDTAGKPCEEVANDKQAKLGSVKTGKWINYHPDGVKIQSSGNFVAGKKEGAWETYSEQGNLTKTAAFIAGKPEGMETTYFDEPGQIWKSKGAYAKALKNGQWSTRTSAQAACVTEGAYAAGIKNGRWRECRKDIETKADFAFFEGAYQTGMRNGSAKFFYPGSVTESQGTFRADAACFEKLSEQEKQTTEKVEQCAKPIGKWVFYQRSGTKKAEGAYDENGRKTGEWHEYYKNGSLVASGGYAANKRLVWTYFSKDGAKYADLDFAGNPLSPKSVKLYVNGKLTAGGEVMMGTVKYDPEKDDLDTRPFNKKGQWIEYHENGKKSGEGEYSMNKRKGPWKLYAPTGELTAEGSFTMDEKQGEWRELKDGKFVTSKYFMGRPQMVGK